MEPVQYYIKEGILYEPVIPDIHDWPIAQLFSKPGKFVEEVITDTVAELQKQSLRDKNSLAEMIERTMYLERIRMVEDPWNVDPKDERPFWGRIKKELVRNEQIEHDPDLIANANLEMLTRIVDRYGNEISNIFRPGSYHFAKRFLPFFFSTLLNASAGKTYRSIINHSVGLQEKVHLIGEVESIRRLATKGTIVLCPTHFSNVDSIIVGWGLHALGLPAFIYGAGLNLYNNKILAFFMERLGAYKVDRRKKNPIYRQTLNSYSTVAIRNGAHSLFFPGGTRSRSGMIEKKLKLGLLGTAIEAQRRNLVSPPANHSGKIFVVPLVMSYHFVLEAASLIKQHLKRTGQEQYYILDKESASYRKFLKFVWTTFSKQSEINLSFGRPMDVFGNFVDEEGRSLDPYGREVDIKAYFEVGGQITEDKQRDEVYTKMLGETISKRFHVENRVFSSHLVAYVGFEMFRKRFPKLDLYGILRLLEEERKLSMAEFTENVERVLNRLREMTDKGKVHLAGHMNNDVPHIIEHGISNLGLYHDKRPLSLVNHETLQTENMNLLYFYHNRLEGYELASYVQ